MQKAIGKKVEKNEEILAKYGLLTTVKQVKRPVGFLHFFKTYLHFWVQN